MELLASLLVALLGVLLDRLAAWHGQRQASRHGSELAQLKRRTQVDRINARIDRQVADETDLGALLDRL